ncbi:unnamed protein product [Blepharisma stoltei]|uniref:Uncharacterized protein n=1 Tax=Blepharisma stoltei TaxID=1481888 RepID=A0AAU9K4G9_9CILI|nr:unnamed protein product [Blepharisma stoltei]
MSKVSMIHYTLQDEGKKELYLYSTQISQGNEVTVKDVRKSFPVPGRFFFRFRTIIQEENPPATVWLDLPEDDSPIPTYKGYIYVKALQLPPFENKSLLKPVRKVYKAASSNSSSRNHHSREPDPPQFQRKLSDFIDFPQEPSPKQKPVDVRSHSQEPPRPPHELSKSHFMSALNDPTNGMSTQELIDRKEKFIQEQMKIKAESAKKSWAAEEEGKNHRMNAEKEFGESINRWESRNLQKNNIITLISTMQGILWPGAEWKPIGPGDLLTSKQVKIAYMKAIMIVHPDKHQQDPPHIKYIADRVFGALNNAYKLYQQQNNS